MGYIRKSLFICIALSSLIGFITHTQVMESESVYACEYLLDIEETSVSEYLITSEINEGDALRHFPPSKRVNNSPSSKYGFAFVKGNKILYISSSTLESTKRFPSGLSEGRKRLINFGVLVI